MSLSHATKNVFLGPFQETSGLNTVTQSIPQSNHTFLVTLQDWPQESPVLRLSKVLLAALDPILQTCLPLAAPSITSGQCVFIPAQLCSALTSVAGTWKAFFFFLHLMGWFSLSFQSLSPSLEAAPICMWLGTGQWLPSGSCRCPRPRTTALTLQQFLHPCFVQPGPDAHSGTEPAWKGFFLNFIYLFCVILQLNQFLHPAHDTWQGEVCWHSRGVTSKSRRGRIRRKNQQLGTG